MSVKTASTGYGYAMTDGSGCGAGALGLIINYGFAGARTSEIFSDTSGAGFGATDTDIVTGAFLIEVAKAC